MNFQLVNGAAGAAAAAGSLVFGGHVQYLLVQMSANNACACVGLTKGVEGHLPGTSDGGMDS